LTNHSGLGMTSSSASTSISVTVRLFAAYADAVGRSSVEIVLPAGATVGDLLAEFRHQVPGAAGLPERPLCAVNLSHVLSGHPLRNHDEVAILPPLAGG
jgi:molybdopterin converting factor small subunit